MKLTVDISDEIAEHVGAIITQGGRMSMRAFIHRAILNELERVSGGAQTSGDLRELTSQVQELRRGQKALIAMVDFSATLLSALLRRSIGG